MPGLGWVGEGGGVVVLRWQVAVVRGPRLGLDWLQRTVRLGALWLATTTAAGAAPALPEVEGGRTCGADTVTAASAPALISARVQCWYEVGRYDKARALLAERDGGDTVEDAAVYIILVARGGDAAGARAALAAARQRFGAQPALDRAALVQRLAAGDGGAWTDLDAALAARPHDPQLVQAAAEMTALQPDAATASARAAVGREEGAAARYNGAALRFEAGDWTGCGAAVDAGLAVLADAPDDTLEARLLGLAHRCAVAGEDLAAANRRLKALGPARARERIDEGALVQHAQLLGAAGAPAAGAKLLGLKPVVDPAVQPARDSAELRLRREAGDLDGALAVARRGRTTPAARANLARALHDAGRTTEALVLLRPACPELRGAARRQCEQYEAALSAH